MAEEISKSTENSASTEAFTNRVAARRRRRSAYLFVAVVVVLLCVGFLWNSRNNTDAQAPRADRYQAVFLDNGQVFFGKLKNTQGEYLVLDNAYYSKKQDLPADATEEQKAAVAGNVSLIKVGQEVYGPENSLHIRSEQVLFWQNLKTDSKVSKAIKSAIE